MIFNLNIVNHSMIFTGVVQENGLVARRGEIFVIGRVSSVVGVFVVLVVSGMVAKSDLPTDIPFPV